MTGQSRGNALDHVIVVVFENRSLDNVLGRLCGPGGGKTFEGVLGKDLTNPIPEWAEHGADRKMVPYAVATDMDSPNPDTGEEHQRTKTQLYNILNEQNRFKLGEEISAPYNAPERGQTPTMDGFVTVYISTLTAELGRQPTYEEYSQVMTVHPGTDPGAERPGPRVRRFRSLVLQDALGLGRDLSTLGKAAFNGVRAYAEQNNIKIEGLPADPQAEIPQSRPCTSSTTSSQSSSPCCIPPIRAWRRDLTPM